MSQTDAPQDNEDGSAPIVAAPSAPPPSAALDAPVPDGPPGTGHVPLGAPADLVGGDDEPTTRRYHKLRIAAVAAFVVIVVAVVSSAFIRVPYYRFSPGSLYATESLIDVSGSPAYKGDGGQIDFTTVSSRKASVLDAVLSHFDQSVDLWDADLIEGGKTSDETRQANLEMMADSKQIAEVVALRKLGYDVKVEGSGALIKHLEPGLPASKVLQVNDTVVAVDGQKVSLSDDLVTAIRAHKPGDTVTMQVQSAPDDPGRAVSVPLVSACATLKPGQTCTEEDNSKPLLGVQLGTRDTHFELPVTLNIDTKDVGGPSAGLALTLGVIDVLTPGSLTGGAHIATTGEIDLDGNVGPIGGIKQKTYLAMRSGVSLFLVPDGDEAVEAQGYAAGSGMRVIGVKTLDDALAALKTNGGSVDVINQAAAANAPATTEPA
jgi:PDZ domain-containing protein